LRRARLVRAGFVTAAATLANAGPSGAARVAANSLLRMRARPRRSASASSTRSSRHRAPRSRGERACLVSRSGRRAAASAASILMQPRRAGRRGGAQHQVVMHKSQFRGRGRRHWAWRHDSRIGLAWSRARYPRSRCFFEVRILARALSRMTLRLRCASASWSILSCRRSRERSKDYWS
jgi:hypothetical protein